ncbi:Cullin-3 [Toensbergia leucococca]|nr:Cullin-3 [Toensbergia leucococca]
MGSADLHAYFPESKGKVKTRELNVSTYMMMILLLFNDVPPGESYTCEEIQAKTNIPFNELTRNLQSLAVAPKTRVLIKQPMSKDVKVDDRFSFNESFHSPYLKIKIGVVSGGNKVEDTDERKETEKKNNDTRGGSIEAAVVRIMKQRKELTHQKLIAEVIQQLNSRFLPDVNMVKKRIESLIEREYLERLENSERPAYRYLA